MKQNMRDILILQGLLDKTEFTWDICTVFITITASFSGLPIVQQYTAVIPISGCGMLVIIMASIYIRAETAPIIDLILSRLFQNMKANALTNIDIILSGLLSHKQFKCLSCNNKYVLVVSNNNQIANHIKCNLQNLTIHLLKVTVANVSIRTDFSMKELLDHFGNNGLTPELNMWPHEYQ